MSAHMSECMGQTQLTAKVPRMHLHASVQVPLLAVQYINSSVCQQRPPALLSNASVAEYQHLSVDHLLVNMLAP